MQDSLASSVQSCLELKSDEEPRLALAGETASTASVISWKPEHWYWLQVYKEHVKNNPDDLISRLEYGNYLRWYKSF